MIHSLCLKYYGISVTTSTDLGWGEALGNKKIEYDDWSGYNKEMLKYCIQDVKVNVDIYNNLLEEYRKIHARTL